MKMGHIMNSKVYLYFICTLFSCFALSGINFEKIIKKNRIWETRILVLLLSLALGYLVSQFILEFL